MSFGIWSYYMAAVWKFLLGFGVMQITDESVVEEIWDLRSSGILRGVTRHVISQKSADIINIAAVA
jgi:hypothetical protein